MTTACYPLKVLTKAVITRLQAEVIFWSVTLVIMVVDDAAMLAMVFS
jgi:hypothetical protein